jgi:hypothetical protein
MKNINKRMRPTELISSPFRSQIDLQFYKTLYRIIYLLLDEKLYIQHEGNIRMQLKDCI